MTPDDLIRSAGLRPKHVRVTGYAAACKGEPAILTGIYDAAVQPAFLLVRARDLPNGTGATALVSAHAQLVSPTELERERLLAESDPDGGVGQERVIELAREYGAAPKTAKPEPPTEVAAEDAAREAAPDISDYPIRTEHGEGWG